jgi:hypothetical protein
MQILFQSTPCVLTLLIIKLRCYDLPSLKEFRTRNSKTSSFITRVNHLYLHPFVHFTSSSVNHIQSFGINLFPLKELLAKSQLINHIYNWSHVAHSDSATYYHSFDCVIVALVYNPWTHLYIILSFPPLFPLLSVITPILNWLSRSVSGLVNVIWFTRGYKLGIDTDKFKISPSMVILTSTCYSAFRIL